MSKRAELRALYIEGWNKMDAEKLVSAVADDFLFDDPADPEPVTKVGVRRLLENAFHGHAPQSIA